MAFINITSPWKHHLLTVMDFMARQEQKPTNEIFNNGDFDAYMVFM
jgi:hypothetical protein